MKRLFVCLVLVFGVPLIGNVAKAQPVVGPAGAGQVAAAATMMSRYVAHQTGLQRGLVQGATLRMVRLNPAVRMNPFLNAATSQTSAAVLHGATAHHHSVRGSMNYGMGNLSMGELRSNMAAHHTGAAQGHGAHALTNALINPTPFPTPVAPGGTLR
jgi:hypothetical protein